MSNLFGQGEGTGASRTAVPRRRAKPKSEPIHVNEPDSTTKRRPPTWRRKICRFKTAQVGGELETEVGDEAAGNLREKNAATTRGMVVPFADFLADGVGSGAAFCGHPSDSSSLRSPDGRAVAASPERARTDAGTCGHTHRHDTILRRSRSTLLDTAGRQTPRGAKLSLPQKKGANVKSPPHCPSQWEFLNHADLVTSASVTGQSSAVCFEKHSHGGRGTPWMAEGGALGVTAAATVGKVPAGILEKTVH